MDGVEDAWCLKVKLGGEAGRRRKVMLGVERVGKESMEAWSGRGIGL